MDQAKHELWTFLAQGEKATAVVHLRFKDGTAEKNTKNGLVKACGTWLLTGGE